MKTKLVVSLILIASVAFPINRAAADSRINPIGLGIITGVLVAAVAANASNHRSEPCDSRWDRGYRPHTREVRYVDRGNHYGWREHGHNRSFRGGHRR